jgi:hypothetical protein
MTNALSFALACAATIGAMATLGPAPALAQLYNPCPFTNDGDCDEPNGLNLCAWGTDTVDCSNPNSNYGGGTGYGGGARPTPTTDASGLYNPCPYTNDGDCDEPNGLNLCAWGTDTVDCSNPNSYYGGGTGYIAGGGAATQGAAPTATAGAPTSYSPWRRITNDPRQYAAQPGGVMPLIVYNDMRFQAGNYVVYHGITDGSGPTAPIWNVQQVPVTLTGGTRYVARASSGGFESFQSAGGSLIMYPEPGPNHAMIYARNDDIQNWRAICVLPVGMLMTMCGP